jgi:hypothetical protein
MLGGRERADDLSYMRQDWRTEDCNVRQGNRGDVCLSLFVRLPGFEMWMTAEFRGAGGRAGYSAKDLEGRRETALLYGRDKDVYAIANRARAGRPMSRETEGSGKGHWAPRSRSWSRDGGGASRTQLAASLLGLARWPVAIETESGRRCHRVDREASCARRCSSSSDCAARSCPTFDTPRFVVKVSTCPVDWPGLSTVALSRQSVVYGWLDSNFLLTRARSMAVVLFSLSTMQGKALLSACGNKGLLQALLTCVTG